MPVVKTFIQRAFLSSAKPERDGWFGPCDERAVAKASGGTPWPSGGDAALSVRAVYAIVGALVAASCLVGTFSTARPTQRLGDTRNVDLSIVKRFSIPEKMKLEVRGDAYNLINQPQFTGLPVSTLGPSLAGTPSFLVPQSPLFGNMISTMSGNPRIIQLALRLMF